MSRKANHTLTLPLLLERWQNFVYEVEAGYDDSIYEYTNDLTVRDLLQTVIDSSPLTLRDTLIGVLQVWDQRFDASTEISARSVLPDKGKAQAWWWFRVPIRPGPELENDLALPRKKQYSMKNLLCSIKKYIKHNKYLAYILFFMGLPFFCMAETLWFDVLKHTESEKGTEIYEFFAVACMFLFMAGSFIVIIVRKENPMPNRPSVKGTPAVIVGVIGSVLCGSVALYALYKAIFLLLAH